jgi:uncharacterized protein YoxC
MNDTLLIFLSFGFFIMVLGILAAVGFLVYAIMEIRRVAVVLEEFLKRTEANTSPVLAETEQTMRSIRKISDDVGSVTDNVKDISDAARELAVNLRALGFLANAAGSGVTTMVSGVKAGITAAFFTMIKEIKERRTHHEK